MSNFEVLAMPKEIEYPAIHEYPSGTITRDIMQNPYNGSTFTGSVIAKFKYLKSGFLDGSSAILSGTATFTSGTGTGNMYILGAPAYSLFSTLMTLLGTSASETIANYGAMMNVILNICMGLNQRWGLQVAIGWSGANITASASADPLTDGLDGRILPVTSPSFNFSIPIMSCLTNAENLIPLFCCQSVEQHFTIADASTISSSMATYGGVATSISLSNLQLSYRCVELPMAIQNMIKMRDVIYIKSTSYNTITTNVAGGANGNISLDFNTSYQSVKGVVVSASNQKTASNGNGIFDAVNLSTSNYQFNIGGVPYPTQPVSAVSQPSLPLNFGRQVFGKLHDKDNMGNITNVQYAYSTTVASTTPNNPAKYYYSACTEKVGGSHDVFVTGQNTNSNPIKFTLNTSASIGATASTVMCVIYYDALIKIYPQTEYAELII
ncbi:MAG TPA: hypothetical protein V6C58_01875 [Allocoleopsis sp.]